MSLPSLSGIVSSISLRIQHSRESLRSLNQKDKDSKSDSGSLKSNASIRSLNKRGSTSSYYPYTVYEQAMSPPILRNAEATRKVSSFVFSTQIIAQLMYLVISCLRSFISYPVENARSPGWPGPVERSKSPLCLSSGRI